MMKFDLIIYTNCWSPECISDLIQQHGNDNNVFDYVDQLQDYYNNLEAVLHHFQSDRSIMYFPDTHLEYAPYQPVLDYANRSDIVMTLTGDDHSVAGLKKQLYMGNPSNVLFIGGCYYSAMTTPELAMNEWFNAGDKLWMHTNGTKKSGHDLSFVHRSNYAALPGLEMYKNTPYKWIQVNEFFWKFND